MTSAVSVIETNLLNALYFELRKLFWLFKT